MTRDPWFRGPSAIWVAGLLALGACSRDGGNVSPEAAATAATASPALYGPRVSALTPGPGDEWNPAQIQWLGYAEGLAKAKAENKPVCLVFFAGWCPHCHNYAHVFADARIVERARRMVMIRLNADDDGDLARKYAPDGGYVPRTFFLGPDGSMDRDIHAPRPKFLYFFDERDAGSLLAGMDAALEKHSG